MKRKIEDMSYEQREANVNVGEEEKKIPKDKIRIINQKIK